MMTRLWVFVLVVTLALSAGPVFAQDGGSTPAPAVDASVVLAAVAIGLLLAFVLVLRPLIERLAESAPPWMIEALFDAVGYGLDRLDEAADATPSNTDDAAVADLRRQIEELRARLSERQ